MVFSPKARMAVCCVAILGIALAIHAQDGVVHSEGGQPTGPSRRFGVPVKVPAQDPTSAPVLPVAASGTILTASDVTRIIEAATKSVDTNSMVIAVTDRQGDILGLLRESDAPSTAIGNFSQQVDTNELAVALARTASFFSNGQAPLSSRTVRFISGIHFPPGIMYTGNAALYGIENTNRGCIIGADYDDRTVPPARSIDGQSPGVGIITGKAD